MLYILFVEGELVGILVVRTLLVKGYYMLNIGFFFFMKSKKL